MAVLADLLIRMGVDSAEVRKGLKSVQSDLQKFTRDVGAMKSTLEGAFAAVGIGVAAQKLAAFVKSGADAADQMGKLAQKAGLSTEAMSGLVYAAKLGDIGSEDLGAALAKLSKTMGDAAQGGKSQQAIFKALGVEWKDSAGNLRPVSMVLEDIADAFAGAEDGPAKAAAAMEIFGRSGASLIPWLNAGAAGMRAGADEAERFGFIVSDEAAKAADEFNDNLDRLHMLGQAVAKQLAGELAPSLNALVDSLLNSATEAGGARAAAEELATGLRVLASVGLGVYAAFKMASLALAEWAALSATLKGDTPLWKRLLFPLPTFIRDATGKGDALKAVLDESDKDFARFGENVKEIWAGIWNTSGGGNNDNLGWAPEGDPQSHEEARPRRKLRLPDDSAEKARLKALAEWMKDFNKLVDEAEKVMDSVATPTEKYEITLRDLGALLAKGAIDQETYARAVKKAGADYFEASGGAKRLKDEMEVFNRTVDEAEKIMDDAAGPLAKYRTEMDRLTQLLQMGAINQEQFAFASDQAAIALAKSNTVISGMADAGVDAFRTIVDAARQGTNILEALWQSFLKSFQAIIDKMVSDWIQAQILMAGGKALSLGGYAGLGETADVGGFMGLESAAYGASAAPTASLAQSAVAAGAGTTEIHMTVNAVDAASFDELLGRNEGVLAARMARLAYKGRV